MKNTKIHRKIDNDERSVGKKYVIKYANSSIYEKKCLSLLLVIMWVDLVIVSVGSNSP